jgi:UDP-N-acetylglucosamine diphosphorylase/glucosamine-1-phosphate N-acetyltransferase
LSIREKWELWLEGKASYITQDYLSDKYSIRIESDNLVINGSIMPNEQLVRLIQQLEMNEALMQDEELIAVRLNAGQFEKLMEEDDLDELIGYQLTETPLHQITQLIDLFQMNGQQIETDYQKITKLQKSDSIPDDVIVENEDNIFIEDSAAIAKGVVINASEGPVYIGKQARIMEGCLIRGPFALCDNAVLKMGTKIYGGTTIGPYSKVGGEVNNSVILGYSNKSHDGFLGNSVLGEWCNLGADTNNSNLKNNYKNVSLWNYAEKDFVNTGAQFCGLFMGDHSKCGINTMFNTGTLTGVYCNIFGDGFPRKFIPSFSWGGKKGFSTHKINKAFETADLVMQRRGKTLSEEEKDIYKYLFENTASFRSWEKSPSGKES